MVRFLLENSLGAWWAGRHPSSPLLKEWEYLRFVGSDSREPLSAPRRQNARRKQRNRNSTPSHRREVELPAAGTFPGWPERRPRSP